MSIVGRVGSRFPTPDLFEIPCVLGSRGGRCMSLAESTRFDKDLKQTVEGYIGVDRDKTGASKNMCIKQNLHG